MTRCRCSARVYLTEITLPVYFARITDKGNVGRRKAVDAKAKVSKLNLRNLWVQK